MFLIGAPLPSAFQSGSGDRRPGTTLWEPLSESPNRRGRLRTVYVRRFPPWRPLSLFTLRCSPRRVKRGKASEIESYARSTRLEGGFVDELSVRRVRRAEGRAIGRVKRKVQVGVCGEPPFLPILVAFFSTSTISLCPSRSASRIYALGKIELAAKRAVSEWKWLKRRDATLNTSAAFGTSRANTRFSEYRDTELDGMDKYALPESSDRLSPLKKGGCNE